MPIGFTPVTALFGGALNGLATTLLLATLGRIAGISGIVNTAIEQRALLAGSQLARLLPSPA